MFEIHFLSKNQENEKGLKENLKAVIPHQIGDHTLCKPVFCGYLRKSKSARNI